MKHAREFLGRKTRERVSRCLFTCEFVAWLDVLSDAATLHSTLCSALLRSAPIQSAPFLPSSIFDKNIVQEAYH